MGREIRRVPPHWEHPRDDGKFRPILNQRFADAAAEWKKNYAAWERGERPDYCTGESATLEFWEWHGGPPDGRETYLPYDEAEATWFQVYETVSEGTPCTPPFATETELVDHLVAEGESLIGRWNDGPWDRANAERFVKRAWAFSLEIKDGIAYTARDGWPE